MLCQRSLTMVLGTASLLLAGCAGTPNSQQAASTKHARCEATTGSLLCGDADDQDVVGTRGVIDSNSPLVNATQTEQETRRGGVR